MKRWLDQRNEDGPPLTIDEVEVAIVETVRAASDISGGSIGRNCISILLKLSDADARVRYFPPTCKLLYIPSSRRGLLPLVQGQVRHLYCGVGYLRQTSTALR
jgi:hypothetical protein